MHQGPTIERLWALRFSGLDRFPKETTEGGNHWHRVDSGADIDCCRVSHRPKMVGIFSKVAQIPEVTENTCRPVEDARRQPVRIPQRGGVQGALHHPDLSDGYLPEQRRPSTQKQAISKQRVLILARAFEIEHRAQTWLPTGFEAEIEYSCRRVVRFRRRLPKKVINAGRWCRWIRQITWLNAG